MKFLYVLAFCLSAAASAAAAQIYTAGKIVFLNPGPYSQAQLESAAQIHPGTRFTEEQLAAAAQRLVDTGYFDDVSGSLLGSVSAIQVTFGLKPTPLEGMLPVDFQNFVWLTPAEVQTAIHAKSPLFNGYLPEGSALQDLLKNALTPALAAKGIDATVEYATIEPNLLDPTREIEFRIVRPAIRVTNVKLAGVSSDLVPFVQKSINSTAKSPYRETPHGLTTADQILQPLFDAGYIRASLADLHATPSTQAGGEAGIIVSASLIPGDVYTVSGISFAGTPLLSAESFASSAKLHPGDTASRKALLETLAPLDSAYRRQGYMDVTIVAAPTFHTQTHQVDYAVSVTPGEQYRIKELSTVNLDPAAQTAFDRTFQMKAGELFNPDYVAEFLKKNSSVAELRPYTANFTVYAHPRTHTVELVMAFMRNNH